jgi:cytidylate kinase
LRERDRRDSTRADAPLKAAADALSLDTTTLSIEEAVAEAVKRIEARQAELAKL